MSLVLAFLILLSGKGNSYLMLATSIGFKGSTFEKLMVPKGEMQPIILKFTPFWVGTGTVVGVPLTGRGQVKDSHEESKDKSLDRRKRKIESATSTSAQITCKSCKQPGHNSARSHDCPNHELVYGNITIDHVQNSYPKLANISAAFNELQNMDNVNLLVEKNNLVGYGHVVSSACESNLAMRITKNLVYDYILDEIFINQVRKDILENIISLEDFEAIPELQATLDTLIQPIKNRLPRVPVTRIEVTKNPFIILNILRYIIEYYEQPEQQEHPNQPRLFSLFPNPSLKWRFIKIDGNNLNVLFPHTRLPRLENETRYNYTLRCFYGSFDFSQFKIRSLQELQNLPIQKGKMFLNGLYTDGYTCRVLFARNVPRQGPESSIKLELSDFNEGEIGDRFRTCFLDPGRKSAYTAYYGNNEVRSLSATQYYSLSGAPGRSKQEDSLKIEQGIKLLETNIPSPRTAAIANYNNYLTYMLVNLNAFFDFYNFRTASINWKNYIGKQCAIEEACNILINGGKKYNPNKRKKTKKNRRDSTKMPLVVFGDGLKGKSHVKLKGRRTGVSEIIYRQLKRREKLGEVLVLDINEFRTSSVCFNCHEMNLRHHQAEDRSFFSILICNSCNIFWNRDVLASKNMMYIASEIWAGNERPAIFSRQNRQSAT
ncbi:hypothetical protein MFLAVUS_002581 [Mucor flavus]|uniref:Cas12f1-like TNB domain-containing protein n=1 Tax=Mucor flavus TaxID=439312 RepID=A0ABP9YQQ1_9FUNG